MPIQFVLPIHLPQSVNRFNTSSRHIFWGSCFSTTIYSEMRKRYLWADVNPFGTVFDAHTLLMHLQFALGNNNYNNSHYFFEANGKTFNYCFNTEFSASSPDLFSAKLEPLIQSAKQILINANYLYLTFGIGWVQHLADVNLPIANRHKQPESKFEARLIDIQMLADQYKSTFEQIYALNPELKIVLTVSPVIHNKGDLHYNLVGKSAVVLLAHTLCSQMPQIEYFSAYEILRDHLRDYRWFAPDLTHPSDQAQLYIFEQFIKAYAEPKCQEAIDEIDKFNRNLEHFLFKRNKDKNPDNFDFMLYNNLKASANMLVEKYNLDLDAISRNLI